MFNAISHLVLAGLCASLLGDALTLLPRAVCTRRFLQPHLLYTIWFASQLTLSFFWPLPLVLLVFGALLMAADPESAGRDENAGADLIGMTLVMVWLVAELWFARPTNTALSGFAGAALLLLSTPCGYEPLSSLLPRR